MTIPAGVNGPKQFWILCSLNFQDDIDDLQNELNNRGGLDPGGEVEEAKAELAKTQKLLSTEKLLKQQAVNKLAEIMNRKDFLNQGKKNKAQQSQVHLLAPTAGFFLDISKKTQGQKNSSRKKNSSK